MLAPQNQKTISMDLTKICCPSSALWNQPMFMDSHLRQQCAGLHHSVIGVYLTGGIQTPNARVKTTFLKKSDLNRGPIKSQKLHKVKVYIKEQFYVWLVSSLTGLDSLDFVRTNKNIFSCWVKCNPVTLETSHTVILSIIK